MYRIIIFAIVIAAIVHIVNDKHKDNTWTQISKTEWLDKRMPSLAPIKKSQWEQNIHSGLIGPSNFTWRGFILIDSNVKERILNQYEWVPVNTPALECTFDYQSNWDGKNWFYNENFDSDICAIWYAHYFFCPETDTVYFCAKD